MRELKQSKGIKICSSIGWELSSKYLEDKICKIKQIQNVPVTLMTFLNRLIFLEKLNLKEDSSVTTIPKLLSKIFNRKTTSKQQYNFCQDVTSLELHDM